MVAAFAAMADSATPETIFANFTKSASKACEQINATLRKQGESIVKQLVAQNKTADARVVAEQLQDKLASKPVIAPHQEVRTLFAQYDGAKKLLVEPIKDSAIRELDKLLLDPALKGLPALVKIADYKSQILSGKMLETVNKPEQTAREFLRTNKVPKVWGYYLTPSFEKRYGTLILDDNGTFQINAASQAHGRWQPTDVPTVLSLDIQNAAGIPELTEIHLNGNEATVKRVSGMRYLKAD